MTVATEVNKTKKYFTFKGVGKDFDPILRRIM